MSRQKLSSRAAVSAFAVWMIAAAAPSHAYRMIQNTTIGRVSAGSLVTCNDPGGFVHWNTRSISWYHNTANQGAGKAAALQAAMNSWTNVPNADHVLTYAGTTTAGWATDNINTVLWASGNGCTGSCLALTALVLQAGQVIVETDVTFNNDYFWRTDGFDYDTEAVAAHEFGHTLGIHHTEVTTTPRPTMYATYFGTDGRSLESDDQAALQCAESRYPRAKYACVINTSGGHTCDSFRVTVANNGGTLRSAVVDLNAGDIWNSMVARVETCNPAGFSFHIADSSTNDAFGGDAATTQHDAEAYMSGTTYSVNLSDFGSAALVCQRTNAIPSSGCTVQQYLVRNDFIDFNPNVNSSSSLPLACSHSALFDFPPYDEGDSEDVWRTEEDKLYLGLNQVYYNWGRTGSGVTRACVFLSSAANPHPLTVAADCGF